MAQSNNGEKETEKLKEQIQNLNQQIKRMEKQLKSYRETINSLHSRLYSKERASLSETQYQHQANKLSLDDDRQKMLLEHDDAVARRLQKTLNPLWMADFEGLAFSPQSKTGSRVGGDFYDIVKVSDNKVAIIIADVSGHGLPAAVLMTTARMAFRTFATTEYNVRSILEKSNQTLLESTLSGHHLTAFLGILDTQLLTLQYANASHCPPCLLSDGKVADLDTGGLFVGMFDDPQYEQKCIQLEKDDKLFLYTDGLLRLFDPTDREKAMAKLQGYLKEYNQLHINEITSRIAFRLEDKPEDDMLILGVQLMRDRRNRKSFRIASMPTEISRVEDTIIPVLIAKGYGERVLFGIKLALEEALVNAIKHGNKLDNTKNILVDFSIDTEKVVISVKDEGQGFEYEKIPDPSHPENLESDCGRGLFLINAYMDKVEFNRSGNKITFTKFAPWSQEL